MLDSSFNSEVLFDGKIYRVEASLEVSGTEPDIDCPGCSESDSADYGRPALDRSRRISIRNAQSLLQVSPRGILGSLILDESDRLLAAKGEVTRYCRACGITF